MDKVETYDTLLMRTYELQYKPSGTPLHPFVKCVEHKDRARLEEIHIRNKYRRSLSALLATKAVKPQNIKGHQALNMLHKFETNLKGKVSQAAPSKEHQKYAALRQGRDPRMNEANAHFDREMEKLKQRMEKENHGFNKGRHEGQRPSTAILAWRPRNPFLTYEKAALTKAQQHELNQKFLHAKVMNDRVQQNNQEQLPDFVTAPEKETKNVPIKRSHSEEQLPWREKLRNWPKPVEKIAKKKEPAATVGPTQEQIAKRLEEVEVVDAEGEKAKKEDADNQEVGEEQPDKEEEKKIADGEQGKDTEDAALLPSQILEQMKTSNIRGIINNMTVHEQLKMMRHIIEDEEFKRRQQMREERAARIAREEERAAAEIEAKKTAQAVINPKPVNMRRKRLDDMTYTELVHQKPCDVIDVGEHLPLTEKNVVAMNEKPKVAKWKIVNDRKRSESPPEKETMVEKKIKFEQISETESSSQQEIDDAYSRSDRLLSQGWIVPEQMDPEEVKARQRLNQKNQYVTERVKEIAERNNLIVIPPHPRLVMGTPGKA